MTVSNVFGYYPGKLIARFVRHFVGERSRLGCVNMQEPDEALVYTTRLVHTLGE